MEEKETMNTNKKQRLEVDFNNLIDTDDEPPAELIVSTTIAASSTVTDDDRRRKQQQQQQEQQQEQQKQEQTNCGRDDLTRLSDQELEEKIRRLSRDIERLKLPDGGAKLRESLQRHEEERERRKVRRLQKDANEGDKPAPSQSLSHPSSCDEVAKDVPFQAPAVSQFASCFVKKLEENGDSGWRDPFDKDLSCLGRCDKRKKRHKGQFSKKGWEKRGFSKGREKTGLLPKQLPLSNFYPSNGEQISSNGDEEVSASLTSCLNESREKLQMSFPERGARHVLHSDCSKTKKVQTVVVVDEEETLLVKTSQAAEEMEPREDPESVEIYYSDLQCLAAQAYLTSTIMNFYIRYLQGPSSPTDRARCDYHFFNTYFYKKLQEAVSPQKSDKEAFFSKFRRWWRGVNIFQKAYILLPIHESLHWSLAIICIPDKEDESGPIILHLDSLGYHPSRSIFDNIKSFLREEWNYVKEDVDLQDISVPERIWKHLPRRIDEKIISVPQQNNDYDCGLFVLYFMERFIEEAPERLKKKDLLMFGRRWFKPEEASNLRGKIKRILMDEFRKSAENTTMWEPVCLPPTPGGDTTRKMEHLEIS
ncbi:hypothetical protein Ancab_020522 [Ancistrocladus abbreviatus]